MEEFKITKYVDLLSDVGFKTVFANEENKTVIINFINRLLRGERFVKSIEFASNEVFGKVYDGKGVRFDLHCVDQDGTRFIVEMQKARHDRDFYQRSVYYGTRAYELQQEKGKRDYFCPPVYVIGIMEGQLDFEKVTERKSCISRYRFAETDLGISAPTTICCIFVQLGLFRKTKEECKDLMDQWCYCLKNATSMQEGPESFGGGEIELLLEASEYDRLTSEKKERYISENMTQRDYEHDKYWSEVEAREEGLAEGMEKGMEKGMKRGLVEGIAATARKMLSCGLDLDVITSCTGLSREQVLGL